MDARERLKQYLASLEEPKKETNQALLENQTSLLENLKQQVEDLLKETVISDEVVKERMELPESQLVYQEAVDSESLPLNSPLKDKAVESDLEPLSESEPEIVNDDEEELKEVVTSSISSLAEETTYIESTKDVWVRNKELKKKGSMQSIVDFVQKHNVKVTIAFMVTVIIGTLAFSFLTLKSNAAKNHKQVASGQVANFNKTAVAGLTKGSATNTQGKQKKSLEEQFRVNLERSAKSLGLDYQIDVHELVAGYLVGTITYHPNDTSKKYIDVSLQMPEKKAEQDTSDAGKAVHDRLTSTLPTINETIKVKDAKKVTVETYKNGENGFISILLYNKKPFGYVTTDKQNIDTNTVTSYYVSEVMAN